MDWVAVGLTRDLGPGQVMPSVVQGAQVAVWRAASGRLSAWGDRCPHRGMRLSHGFVRGETLACIYHGWVYGTDGACRRIPAHPGLEPPAAIRVQAWDVVETGGAIFVGRGAPPVLDGWQGLRSMPFDRFDPVGFQVDGPLWIQGDPGVQGDPGEQGNLALLVQPRAQGVMIHALYRGGDPVALSRRLEALRFHLEGVA